ncbi:MAG: nucleotidyltransferase family protein [Kiritimatiellales bacterium]|nr:nucleotidyltransferase family protein [Kiritimatiellota bacterium]MBL7016170.1 nucleotidyltransferase family protein [Kiritimatiellales bacterium]
MSGLEKIKKSREKILAVALRHGAEDLRVFGSVVRNEDQPDSDVDFLVTMRPGYDLLDMIALSQDLEELLHQKADVVSDEEVSPYLRDQIFQEAVAV